MLSAALRRAEVSRHPCLQSCMNSTVSAAVLALCCMLRGVTPTKGKVTSWLRHGVSLGPKFLSRKGMVTLGYLPQGG